MEKTDTNEYIVLNGRAKVTFHGTPNQDRLKKSASEFIKAALRALGNEQLLQEYLNSVENTQEGGVKNEQVKED